jgi:hypothetical protein
MTAEETVSSTSFDWQKLLEFDSTGTVWDTPVEETVFDSTTRAQGEQRLGREHGDAFEPCCNHSPVSEDCDASRFHLDLNVLSVTDHAAFSSALSELVTENERLRQRVAELEARLASREAQLAVLASSPASKVQTTASSGPATTQTTSKGGQRMVVGFAYLTKSLVRELASFLTISNGHVGWADSPCTESAALSERETSEPDEATFEWTDSEMASKTSTCTADVQTNSKRAATEIGLQNKCLKRSKHSCTEQVVDRPYRSAAQLAANGAMYSIFFFYSLGLLPPILELLGLLRTTSPSSFHTLALPSA